MTSFARYKPFYASFSIRNDGLKDPPDKVYDVATTPDNTVDAMISEVYNSPIVEKASDFLCAVERMEIATNGIPFYDGDQLPRERIIVTSRVNPALSSQTFELDTSSYSLTHL